jgi:hypothetical protein
MFERGFGIVVEKLTGCYQVTRNEIRCVAVQRGEFAADFRRELPCLDLG